MKKNYIILALLMIIGAPQLYYAGSGLSTTRNKPSHFDQPPPLITAIKNGHVKQIKKLIHNGADVNTRDANQRTPLTWAIKIDRIDIATLLLAHPHINVNQADFLGNTPLLVALCCYENNNRHSSDIITLLLSHPTIKVNQANDQHTPLKKAIGLHDNAIAKQLLTRSDIDVNNGGSGHTPLTWSITIGNNEIAKLLLARPDTLVNTRTSIPLKTPFLTAIASDNVIIAQLLIARSDFEVNQPHENGYTHIMHAIQYQNKQLIALMLAREDINLDDSKLYFFIEKNQLKYPEEIALVLAAKAKPILHLLKCERSSPDSLFSYVPLDIIHCVSEQILGRGLTQTDRELYSSLSPTIQKNKETLEMRETFQLKDTKPLSSADAAKG